MDVDIFATEFREFSENIWANLEWNTSAYWGFIMQHRQIQDKLVLAGNHRQKQQRQWWIQNFPEEGALTPKEGR